MTYENHKGEWKTKKNDIGQRICIEHRTWWAIMISAHHFLLCRWGDIVLYNAWCFLVCNDGTNLLCLWDLYWFIHSTLVTHPTVYPLPHCWSSSNFHNAHASSLFDLPFLPKPCHLMFDSIWYVVDHGQLHPRLHHTDHDSNCFFPLILRIFLASSSLSEDHVFH